MEVERKYKTSCYDDTKQVNSYIIYIFWLINGVLTGCKCYNIVLTVTLQNKTKLAQNLHVSCWNIVLWRYAGNQARPRVVWRLYPNCRLHLYKHVSVDLCLFQTASRTYLRVNSISDLQQFVRITTYFQKYNVFISLTSKLRFYVNG